MNEEQNDRVTTTKRIQDIIVTPPPSLTEFPPTIFGANVMDDQMNEQQDDDNEFH